MTQFTIYSIVKCLVSFADAEFTRETSESIARARSLYQVGIELLDSDYPDVLRVQRLTGATIDLLNDGRDP